MPQKYETLGEALRRTRYELATINSNDIECEELVMAAHRKSSGGKINRMELFADFSHKISPSASVILDLMLQQRREGRPLQYITGVQKFLDHEYEVNPGVLIPRPETEGLVLTAIGKLRQEGIGAGTGIELGIGSGVISIELLSAFPCLKMISSELTEDAEKTARNNAVRILGVDDSKERLKISRAFDERNIFEPFEHILSGCKADFFISNPPYLSKDDTIEQAVLNHEPQEALFPPACDPFFFYKSITRDLRHFIKRGGFAFLEMPHERAGAIADIFRADGFDVRVERDLAGYERVLEISYG